MLRKQTLLEPEKGLKSFYQSLISAVLVGVPSFLSVRLRFVTITVIFDPRAIPYARLIFKVT